jgi:hypothetical protein
MQLNIVGNRKFPFKLFQWNLTEFCNFSCEYCRHTSIASKWYDKDAVERMKYLNSEFSKSELNYCVEFFGGEPTLHPQIKRVCSECDVNFILFSNLSNFEIVKDLCKNQKLTHIFTTYHFQYELDLNKIQYLLDCGKQVHINVMIENIVNEKYILEKFKILTDLIGSNGEVTLRIIDFYNSSLNRKYYEFTNLTLFFPYILDSQYIEFPKKLSELDLSFDTTTITTKLVSCNITRYFSSFIQGKYHKCCSLNDEGSEEFKVEIFDKEILCKNKTCNRCDLRYGMKKGLFYDTNLSNILCE